MINRIVATATINDNFGNKHPVIIRIVGNEITFCMGNSALSNHFDMKKLKRILHKQSNQDILDAAQEALKYKNNTLADVDLACDP